MVRFIGLIDDKGARTEEAHKTFTLHDITAFQQGFSELVQAGYSDLFSLHGNDAWMLDRPKLITFFRQTDQSSELVGTLQASTFKALAVYAGHGTAVETPKVKGAAKPKPSSKTVKSKGAEAPLASVKPVPDTTEREAGERERPPLGLTVRIEINLPAQGDRATYDAIFKSIRDNLLNG